MAKPAFNCQPGSDSCRKKPRVTCLHPERGTNSQYGKENNERNQPRRWRAVARIRDRPDNHQKEERGEELQREHRTDEDSGDRRHHFCRVHLIEEAVRRRHIWRLMGKASLIGINFISSSTLELTAYEAKSDAVPGTVRMPSPPSNKLIALE